jgi:hypothetical protein
MEIRKIKNLKKLNVSTVPVLQKTVKLLDLENAEPLELLSIVPFGASYPHEYTHRVAVLHITTGYHLKTFIHGINKNPLSLLDRQNGRNTGRN